MQKLSDNKKFLDKLTKHGVNIIDPNAVYVEGEVNIGKGTTIFPSVYLTNSRIGKNCKIGPLVEIVDSKIGDKAEILFTAQIKRCTIGLNFFMHHHSYIGDAKVGNNVNVGAGFIVCNYDGKDKHKTIIGDDVFLGSNSVVIAPNKIERGVFIAAGSVIPANTKTGKNNLIICREKEILIKKIN